jgi:TRAP-type uncharacterized transport system substrate-binding protein/HAMP domain-containing protein
MSSTSAKTTLTGGVAVLAGGLALFGYATIDKAAQLDKAGKIVMATGNDDYYRLATNYKNDLQKFGVTVDLRQDTEGFGTLKALVDYNSGITAGFIKVGVVGSMQGRLAGEKSKDWRTGEIDKLRSVGRLFYEPIWVFTRGDLPIESLRDLKGKTILVGTRESGTRRIANQLLKANGIDRRNSTYVEGDLGEEAEQLRSGSVEAAVLILPADSPRMQKLLRVPNIRLMDFSPESDAYVNRFPALSKVVLRRGAVEFNPVIPSADITLLATTVALVVRKDMQPALISLLTHAVLNNPRSGFDKLGDPVLFYHPGDFPTPNDPEFELANDARLVYKSGELPFVLRQLAPVSQRFGVPFGYTAFASAHAAKLVLLIPLLAVILPMFKIIPAIYVWNIRRRLIYWYRQLKSLERRLDTGKVSLDPAQVQTELDRIENGVKRIWVPLHFSNQLYDLRGHIDLMRHRLVSRVAAPTRMAAE